MDGWIQDFDLGGSHSLRSSSKTGSDRQEPTGKSISVDIKKKDTTSDPTRKDSPKRLDIFGHPLPKKGVVVPNKGDVSDREGNDSGRVESSSPTTRAQLAAAAAEK